MISTLILPNDIFFTEVEALLQEGQPVRIKPKGRSMEPFIRETTDEIILEKAQELKVGQIVLARGDDGHRILHRIIQLNEDKVILMGDGNLHGTEQFTKDQILGTVSHIIRNGKYIDCQSISARMEEWIWRKSQPLRRLLLGLYHFFYNKKTKKES